MGLNIPVSDAYKEYWTAIALTRGEINEGNHQPKGWITTAMEEIVKLFKETWRRTPQSVRDEIIAAGGNTKAVNFLMGDSK
jgi:hypothetical protein